MIKKTLITLGVLAATTLGGCVVVPPRPPVAYAYGPDDYGPPAPVVFAPVPVPVPFFGFWGGHYGYYGHGYYHGGGRWR